MMDLVQHICKEAPGLSSCFHIQKSNCAFANFKDEESCTTALQKVHDSQFGQGRLVARLRNATVKGATGQMAPTGPAATSSHPAADDASGSKEKATGEADLGTSNPTSEDGATVPAPQKEKDRFFILKSLTEQDLKESVQTKLWATQSQNEEKLSQAFEVSRARQNVAW
jgi:YT521-B-like domain-containing protein